MPVFKHELGLRRRSHVQPVNICTCVENLCSPVISDILPCNIFSPYVSKCKSRDNLLHHDVVHYNVLNTTIHNPNIHDENNSNCIFMIDPSIFSNDLSHCDLTTCKTTFYDENDSNYIFMIDTNIFVDDIGNCNMISSNSSFCDENDSNYIFMIDTSLFVDDYPPPDVTVNNSPFNAVKDIRLKYARNIIISHINVNSLRRKFDELSCLLQNAYVDILCISETKLDSADKDTLFNVEGFTSFRQDKRKNSGGLMIYVNDQIPCRQVQMNTNTEILDVESLTVELIFEKDDKWLLCYIYKNPKVSDNDYECYFSNLFNKIASLYDTYMFIGDFNMNFLDPKSRIHDICSVHGLHNQITAPTCWKGATGTLIDLFLVPDSEKTRFLKGYSEDIGTSDFHSLILTPMRKFLPIKREEYVYYRKTKNINYDHVRCDLLELNLLQQTLLCDNVDKAFHDFHKSLYDIFNAHAPVIRRKRDKKSFPIMNTMLKRAILYRNRLRNKYYKTRSTSYYALYKAARNKVTKVKRDLISTYFQEKCKGGTSNKKFWRTVKPFMSDKIKSRNNIILKEDDQIISDQTQLCNVFCDFFTNIGLDKEEENNDRALFSIIHDYLNHPSIKMIEANTTFSSHFNIKETNIVKMKEVINKLDNKKAAGYDEIPPVFIKSLKNDISETLVVLFNKCVCECTFPNSLKMANISPIYKKKDRLNKDNYRSINLLSIVSKIFERLIADQIEVHCKTFFHPLLSGFRKQYGCSDLLSRLLTDWKISLDNKQLVGIIAIDLSKAFDCMPKGLLLSKMYAYGFSYDTCRLMKSYLCSRKQRVKIGNHSSKWASPNRGVPQGSILGPILFNVFLNDLLYSKLHSSIYNYADDNTLSISSSNINDITNKLCQDLATVCIWFEHNRMKANPDKFQAMFIGSHINSVDVQIKFKDVTLQGAHSINILGVEFDHQLSFSNHIQEICNKTSRQINASMRIKSMLDEKSKLAIYKAFIASNFNYCNCVWAFASKSNLVKLDKINERAIRMIYNDKTTTYDTLLMEKGHLDIFRICYKSLCIMMYKIWNGISPPYLNDMFNVRKSHYDMRDNKTYTLPTYKTKKHGYNSLSYLGPKVWNTLDKKLKNTSSPDTFKKKVHSYIVERNKYNIINDFF